MHPVCGVGALCAVCKAACVKCAVQCVYIQQGVSMGGVVCTAGGVHHTSVCVYGVHTAGGMHLMGYVYSKGGVQQTA